MKRRILLSLFLLGLMLTLLLGPGISTKTPSLEAQSNPAAEILQLINGFRASQGLPPFQYNNFLASAAQAHANWMATTSIISHTGSNGSTPQSRSTAAGYVGYVVENIVGGSSMSPRQGLIWWQNSPIHYNTLVTSRYPQAGVGFATYGGQNMFVLVVGRPPGLNESGPAISRPDTSAAPLIITPIELAEPREDGSIIHVIQQGQAMWTIAAYYDVDLAHLYLINSLTEDDLLHPGNEVTVRLADGAVPPPTPTPPLTHTVQDGESAWSIALINGIDLGFLYLLNNMTENSVLHPGDEVIVRLAEGQSPPPTPTPRTTHIVQNGQSLWLIAALYNLTLEQLMELNDLAADSLIRVGDELLIRPPTPTPLPTDTATPTPEGVVELTPTIDPYPGPTATITPIAQGVATTTAGDTSQTNPQDEGPNGLTVALLALGGLSLLAIGGVALARRQKSQDYPEDL